MKNTIIVIGDIMLDRYLNGEVNRISPEAPVPIVKIKSEYTVLGGAANVANNISSLGSPCKLFGHIGNDQNGTILNNITNKTQIDLLALNCGAPTITKTRVVGGHQQIVRLDHEEKLTSIDTLSKSILSHLTTQIKTVIMSDYAKGICTNSLCQTVINKCNQLKIKVIIDPKGKDWSKYQNAYMLTPNLKELSEVLGKNIANNDLEIEISGQEILKNINLQYLLVTRSEKGMSLIHKQGTTHFPTLAKEVYDVSGAGDTVIATLAWALSENNNIESAVHKANTAAGIVVSKFGTAPIEKNELIRELNSSGSKIPTQDELLKIIQNEKQKNKRIVFTNGCFDILHRGHLDYLQKASKLGEIFIVAINSDNSVKKLKGINRPINSQIDRAEMLAGYDFINYITIFDEETPLNLIKSIRPDILVKGGDYQAEEVVGKEFSGKVIIIPFLKGYSSTNIINKLS